MKLGFKANLHSQFFYPHSKLTTPSLPSCLIGKRVNAQDRKSTCSKYKRFAPLSKYNPLKTQKAERRRSRTLNELSSIEREAEWREGAAWGREKGEVYLLCEA